MGVIELGEKAQDLVDGVGRRERRSSCFSSGMAPRAWLIVLDLGEGGEPCLHATVGDDVLLSGKPYRHPIEALEYVDRVLTDFRVGEDITLIALNAPTPFASWSTRLRSVAIQWCAIVLSRSDSAKAASDCRKLRDVS